MKYSVLMTILFLSACGSQNLQSHLEAERDFHANQQYQEDIYNHKAYRPEVYADEEFLADCDYYQMKECFE